MPRQKNTRPTNIYWLYDTRPEKVAEFGPEGQPFYCGKTVLTPVRRLDTHRYLARKHPQRNPHYERISACGEHISMRVVEIVSAEDDWCARERFWIATIRRLYPGGTNASDGGEGAPGWVPSAEFREKVRLSAIGRKASPETCAKISAALKGRKRSAETCAKLSAAKRGKSQSAEANAKRSATQRGRARSPEAVAKTAAGLRGKKRPPELCARMSAARKGVKRGPFSPKTCAKISARKAAWWANPANKERARLKHAGRKRSPETCARISAAKIASFAAKRAAANV